MSKSLKKFILTLVIVYAGLYFLSEQLANFSLAVFLVLLVPGLILRHFFMDALYKGSIKLVPQRFVFNQYTLCNDHCTVKYTPDEKLIVTDNLTTNKKREKRTFIISKSNKVNINKCWNQACKIFDGFISLDSLASFYSYDTKVEVITLESKIKKEPETVEIQIDSTKNGPKFVDIEAVVPDPYNKDTEKIRETVQNFVNIENIKDKPEDKEREIHSPEFVEMGDILSSSSNKIDINSAAASQISILPGINIIMAKKIVEYRDTNGLFVSVDDFIQAANVKEHFIPKIKSMIVAGKPSYQNNVNDDDDEGRIVDI